MTAVSSACAGATAARRGTDAPDPPLFLFIGADPDTDWLAECGVALDAKGFVRTGAGLGAATPRRWRPAAAGVFAIGDVRSGSVKRVGGAVGEGAQVVAALHAYLARRRTRRRLQPIGRIMMAEDCTHIARHSRRDAERARLRGMPEDRRIVGASAPLPHLRPCRLLRRLAQPPRHQAFPRDPPSDHRRLRSAGRLGLVLRRRGDVRPVERTTPHNGPIPRYY